MAKKPAQLDREILTSLRPECSILHGRHLAGPGAARFGWFARWPGGRMEYLGKTLADAVSKISR
jgi:hypothetical protein